MYRSMISYQHEEIGVFQSQFQIIQPDILIHNTGAKHRGKKAKPDCWGSGPFSVRRPETILIVRWFDLIWFFSSEVRNNHHKGSKSNLQIRQVNGHPMIERKEEEPPEGGGVSQDRRMPNRFLSTVLSDYVKMTKLNHRVHGEERRTERWTS